MRLDPGLYRVRNGSTVEIFRTKTYHWSSKYSSGSVTLVEGEHCVTGQQLVWDTDGFHHGGNGIDDPLDILGARRDKRRNHHKASSPQLGG